MYLKKINADNWIFFYQEITLFFFNQTSLFSFKTGFALTGKETSFLDLGVIRQSHCPVYSFMEPGET